jgi:hypothetical protein
MPIDQFEELPQEGELGMTPVVRRGVVDVVLAVAAVLACGAVTALILLT